MDRSKLRNTLSEHVPETIKYVMRKVLAGLHELNRPIHAYLHRTYPKVLQTSIPKSGTHLLNQVLEGIGYWCYKNQPFNPNIDVSYEAKIIIPHLSRLCSGEYFTEHLTWNDQIERILLDAGFKILCIYRDPRATAVSAAIWIPKVRSHWTGDYYRRNLPSLHERVIALLDGIPDNESPNGIGLCPWPDLYDKFLPWKESPAVFSVSFENLIGPRGGGSTQIQMSTIEGILGYITPKCSQELACRLATKVYNPSVVTFHKGQINSWRAQIDRNTESILNQRLARQVVEWGYEI